MNKLQIIELIFGSDFCPCYRQGTFGFEFYYARLRNRGILDTHWIPSFTFDLWKKKLAEHNATLSINVLNGEVLVTFF